MGPTGNHLFSNVSSSKEESSSRTGSGDGREYLSINQSEKLGSLHRCLKGIGLTFLTVISLGTALFSRKIRDSWKEVFSGKKIVHIKPLSENTVAERVDGLFRQGLKHSGPPTSEGSERLSSVSTAETVKISVGLEVNSETESMSIKETKEKLLEAYNLPSEGWIVVGPKKDLKAGESFSVGMGAVGFEGNGRWKIHVSINPDQMEEAIPIIVEVLHGENAPRLGFIPNVFQNLVF